MKSNARDNFLEKHRPQAATAWLSAVAPRRDTLPATARIPVLGGHPAWIQAPLNVNFSLGREKLGPLVPIINALW